VSSELSQQIKLAIPLAAQQLGFQLMGTVDAAMLGRSSDAALAGAGVGNNLLFAITSVGLGIVMGLDTVVPQAIGGGRRDDARRALGAGLRLAVIVGLAATLLVFASPLLLSLADVTPDVADAARVYVYVRAVGVVPFLVTVAYRSYLAAHSTTRPLVIAVVGGNILNALLDVVLIYGKLGLPALGVIGAALATSIVQLITLAIYVAGVRELDDHAPRPRSTADDMRQILRYGGPIGGQLLAEVGIFGVATVIAAHLGKIPAAAHSIALNLASFTFSFAVGVGSATSVRVGHAVGAGDFALARQRGMLGLGLGLSVMGCFAIAFLLVPAALAAMFTDDGAVIAATIPLLQIAALFQLSDGTQAIGAGALRGLGDTRATLVGNVIGHYGIGLAISLSLAFAAHMGAPGLWWGLSAGLTVTAIYLIMRFVAGTNR
jgi:MATE family, multidrug efflux pump